MYLILFDVHYQNGTNKVGWRKLSLEMSESVKKKKKKGTVRLELGGGTAVEYH